MLRVTSKFENDRAECEVELGPKDKVEDAYALAVEHCKTALGISAKQSKLNLNEIRALKRQAEHRPVDLSPFGGVETFVSSRETTIPRDALAELCDLALKART